MRHSISAILLQTKQDTSIPEEKQKAPITYGHARNGYNKELQLIRKNQLNKELTRYAEITTLESQAMPIPYLASVEDFDI